MAGILYHAGFNLEKILDAIDYPKCVSIRQYFAVNDTPSDINVTIYSGEREESIILSEDQINSALSSPHIPLESYVNSSGSHVFQFNYNMQGTSVMLKFTDRLSIPSPLDWPTLDFITTRYPPPKT